MIKKILILKNNDVYCTTQVMAFKFEVPHQLCVICKIFRVTCWFLGRLFLFYLGKVPVVGGL